MQRKILIIDDHDDLASALSEVFEHSGHEVMVLERREDALAIENLESFDVVITDLDVSSASGTSNAGGGMCLPDMPKVGSDEHVKAFKLCAANFRRDGFDEAELKDLVATVLDYKIRFVDRSGYVQVLRENIEFELPSTIALMHIVLEYLLKRVEKLCECKPDQSNLFVALDEAFVNAVKHGNKFDTNKVVRVKAEISAAEAKFIVEDEGDGFDVNSIPDPLNPDNLFKTSGRGVLFIYNIMDEVVYNDRGNRVTMVKKSGEYSMPPGVKDL